MEARLQEKNDQPRNKRKGHEKMEGVGRNRFNIQSIQGITLGSIKSTVLYLGGATPTVEF